MRVHRPASTPTHVAPEESRALPPGRGEAGHDRSMSVISRNLFVGAALLVSLVVYDLLASRLPDLPLWGDVALTALVLMPATFALVWLALPLREARGLALVGLAIAILAAASAAAGLDIASNFAKLAAATALGFWFLGYFERVSWVVLVAAIIPVVDAVSVWRGPTHEIVTERPRVFDALSFSFPVPAEGGFQLGLPDLLFFALFLAAAGRWALRVSWTWAVMVASFGATMALAVSADPFGIGGLPALPLLAIAFLVANADLLWRDVRRQPDAAADA